MTQATEMIRVYFAVRMDGVPQYLNADGKCVDRGHVCSPVREHAEAAALACVTSPRIKARRGQVVRPRLVEVRSTLAPADYFPGYAA